MTGKEFYSSILSHEPFLEHFKLIKTETEHSGHLETIKAKVFNEEIDFVHLRREIYSSDSRIPVLTELSTPHEDSKRRDLTMNSLFYNINENCIEDFTECGKLDLTHGIVRTPTDPVQSFLDDPLRLLRSIRFASNFNFILEDSLFEAGQLKEVHEGLKSKVSRERIGVEVEKILQGNDPVGGFALLHEMGIENIVFGVPVFEKDQNSLKCLEWREIEWKNALFRMRTMFHRGYKDPSVLMAAFLSVNLEKNINRFRDKKIRSDLDAVKYFVDKILIDSLRLKGKISVDTAMILHYAYEIGSNLQYDFFENTFQGLKCEHPEKHIIEIGHWIRGIKEQWEISAHLASLLHTKSTELDENVEMFLGDQFCKGIKSVGFEKVIHMKPLLNGNEVSTILNLGKKGNLIGTCLVKMLEWQLVEYKQNLTKEDAIVWLKKQSHDDLFAILKK